MANQIKDNVRPTDGAHPSDGVHPEDEVHPSDGIKEHVFLVVRTNLYKAREIATQALSESDRSEVIILNPRDRNNSFARLLYARLPMDSPFCELLREKKGYRELSAEEFKQETNYELLSTISDRFGASITEISLGKYRSNRIRTKREDKS